MFGLRVRPTFKTEVRAELGLLFERTSAEVSEVLVKKLKTPRFKVIYFKSINLWKVEIIEVVVSVVLGHKLFGSGFH